MEWKTAKTRLLKGRFLKGRIKGKRDGEKRAEIAEKVPKQKTTLWVIIILVVIGVMIAFFGVTIIGLLSLISGEEFMSTSGSGNVAVIEVKGMILVDTQGGFVDPGVAASSTIVELIEEANAASDIDAIILDINSGGGSAVASDEIAAAVKKVEKPVVGVIREAGASGAYWIASSTDHIVANRMSITGSIGVISTSFDLSDFIERYNISYRRMVAGHLKDAGTPFRELTEEEEMLFQKLLDDIHEEFIVAVSENRGLHLEEVRELATGFVYLGREAKELGLVDELGGFDEARTYLEEELGTEVGFVKYEPQLTFFDALAGVSTESGYQLGRGVGDSLVSDGKGEGKVFT